MDTQRSTPKKYHDYDKDAFCISGYYNAKRPHLKKQVRCKVGGKWVKRFFKNEREAKTYVDLRRIELRIEGEQGLMLPAEIRVEAIRAHEQLTPFGKTIGEAVEFYLAHVRTERGSIPVRQAVDELIANRTAAGLSAVYVRDLKFRLGRFAKCFGDRSAACITTREITKWLESLGVAPVTRNTFRRDARTLFSFCVQHGYCTGNPVASKATLAKEQPRDVQVLSVDQARALLTKASRDMIPYWSIGLFAGLRPSEIRKLLTAKNTKTQR
jgi:integrase